MFTLDTFYRSNAWERFRQMVIEERTTPEGYVMDEYTGKPILKKYDVILHHKIYLTEENVNDYNISLNPDNIMIVSHKTHNHIHNKGGWKRAEVFLVYGSPLSGKTTYVNSILTPGDLVVDIDNIWQCVSGLDRYQKPGRLNSVVFAIRDELMKMVKYRVGKWQNAYIVGGYPLIGERERICKTYGAREIYIESTKEECLERLKYCEDRDEEQWTEYIDTWWSRYRPPVSLI